MSEAPWKAVNTTNGNVVNIDSLVNILVLPLRSMPNIIVPLFIISILLMTVGLIYIMMSKTGKVAYPATNKPN